MRKVYTVYGSEDGTLGVYSNKKIAYDVAMEYLTQHKSYGADDMVIFMYNDKKDEVTKHKATYASMCRKFRSSYTSNIIRPDGVECTVSEFILNQGR